MNINKKRSAVWKVSREEFIKIVEQCNTCSEILHKFGLRNVGSNFHTLNTRLKYEGVVFVSKPYANRRGKKRITNEQAFSETSTYGRHSLKRRILKDNLIPYICSECQIQDTWINKKLVLVLDHVNGICNDNRIENLRFLCPNCNSQTETFAGKNKKYDIPNSANG